MDRDRDYTQYDIDMFTKYGDWDDEEDEEGEEDDAEELLRLDEELELNDSQHWQGLPISSPDTNF